MRSDESTNVYQINPSNYHKILKNEITDTYKIDHNDNISRINNDTLKFANKLHIEDKLAIFNMKDAYILFKKTNKHKPNFENKLQSRLINSSKTELGIILNNIIQNIVLNIQKQKNKNFPFQSLEEFN